MGEKEEAAKRFDEFLKDEKFKKGKEPLHDVPNTMDDDKPFSGWKQDKNGHWYLPGWKREDDTWVEEGD